MTYATKPAVPEKVAEAATGLGALVRVFERARQWVLFVGVWATFLILSCVAGADLTDGGKSGAQVTAGVVLIVLPGLAALWVSVEFPQLNPAARRRRVYVFDEGFVRLSRRGVPTARRWDEVAGIYQNVIADTTYGVRTGTNQNYRLHFTDGTTTKLLGFTADMTQLGPLVMAGVTEAQMPGALEAVRSGRTVAFGPFLVNAQGVATDSKTLPWSEVAKLDYDEEGRLKIRRRVASGKPPVWASAMCRRIPNLHTFIRLANRLIG